MSVINNYPQNTLVTSTIYNVGTCEDLYQRHQVEASVLPCIFKGLAVTSAGGLQVNVSPGTARGQNIVFTGKLNAPSEPTNIVFPASFLINIPANSTGWVVLNVNIQPAPSTNSNVYQIEPDDNGSPPVICAQFVTTLQPSTGTSYPYTQIVLANVVSNASTVTISNTQRAFDFTAAFEYLEAYRNPSNLNSEGYEISPAGVIKQWGTITIPTADIVIGSTLGTLIDVLTCDNNDLISITFPIPFQSEIFYLGVETVQSPNTNANLSEGSYYVSNTLTTASLEPLHMIAHDGGFTRSWILKWKAEGI